MQRGNGNGSGPEVFEADQYFYHPDHLGSSSYVTDVDGEIFQHLEYFPFGETWVEESSNTQRTPYLFTGKELDEETGLYYFGARYYDPRTSVWQSPDPILARYMVGSGSGSGVFTPSNLNLYGYVQQNPIMLWDPDGEEAYPVSRDLAGSTLGAHSFIAIITTDVTQYPEAMRSQFVTVNNSSGNIPGVEKGADFSLITIGGQDSDNQTTWTEQFGENRLVGAVNEASDILSIEELADGNQSWANSFNAKLYDQLTDSNPSTSAVDLDVNIFDANERYDNDLPYALLGGNKGQNDGHNCHGYCAGLAASVGVTNYPTNFKGYDPGTDNPTPAENFE